ncbi:MAG: GNAT family N-acetyltransferase [Ruminococcus sp.]|nr:GNAT family N-acetyltransferase [Ruminococcus sp.]
MILNKADLNDIHELVRLRLEYLAEDHGGLSDKETELISASLPDYFLRRLNKELFVYTARTEERIISCCFLLVTEKPANPDFINGLTGTVLNVYTEKPFRRQGIAGKLINNMLKDAKDMGLDFVELKATEDGYPLYKKLGFADAVNKYRSMKYVL